MKTSISLAAVVIALGLGPTSAMAEPFDLLQTFKDPNPGQFDNFGESIAGVGNNVLVGSQGGTFRETGAAHLFDGSTGDLLKTFLNPTPGDAGEWEAFGISVAAVGPDLLVGAERAQDSRVLQSGAAYLFDGTTHVLKRTFTRPTPGYQAFFGSSVAAVGNDVLIGARLDDAAGEKVGAAYLFDGTSGRLLHTFLNPTPSVQRGRFGQSVAAVGNNVLIGARGAAHLFDGSTGQLLHTFLKDGMSVAALGENVLIGAPHDSTVVEGGGAAYLFDGSTGDLLHTFKNPNPGQFDLFGESIAGVGSNVLIGAPGDDTGVTNIGAAYLFDGSTGDLLLITP